MCSHSDMQTHARPATDCISVHFGADSSSKFQVKCGQTDKQTYKLTDTTDHPTHIMAIADVGIGIIINIYLPLNYFFQCF